MNELFVWEKPVHAAWQKALDDLHPRSELISWLVLGWCAGTPIDPVQRWVIYEATPAKMVSPFFLEDLADLLNTPRNELDSEQRRIVDYWKAEQALLQPFWVIQGKLGGHKYRFSKDERKYLRLEGKPSDPPLPGDLPYADFDERTLTQVLAWNLLRKGHANLKNGRLLERKKAGEEWRKHLLKWLNNQIIEPSREAIQGRSIDDVPTLKHGENLTIAEELDESDERFVATGQYY